MNFLPLPSMSSFFHTVKRSFALLAAGALLLQPLSALAALQTPSDLWHAIEADNPATSNVITVRGHIPKSYSLPVRDVWFTSWITWNQEFPEGMKSLDAIMNGKVSAKMTTDVAMGDAKFRVKWELKMVKKAIYIRMTAIEGDYEDIFQRLNFHFDQKKWLMVPLDMDQLPADVSSGLRELLGALVSRTNVSKNEAFSMESSKTKAGISYTLRLKAGRMLDDLCDNFSLCDETQLTIKVDMNSINELLFMKYDANVKTDSIDVSIENKVNRLPGGVLYVETPKNLITLEEVMKLYDREVTATGLPEEICMGDCRSNESEAPVWEETWEDSDVEQTLEKPESVEPWEREEPSKPEVAPYERQGMMQNRTPSGYRSERKPTAYGVETRGLNHQTRRTTLRQAEARNFNMQALGSRHLYALTEGDPLVIGDRNAPITIVEFGDYECPACGIAWQNIYPALKRDYIDTGNVRYVFRSFPISYHKHSMLAAEAVECSRNTNDQVAWKLHDRLMKAIADSELFTEKKIVDWAKELGADVRLCLQSHEKKPVIDLDVAVAARYDVTGVPTVFIVSREGIATSLVGAMDISDYDTVIDALLR